VWSHSGWPPPPPPGQLNGQYARKGNGTVYVAVSKCQCQRRRKSWAAHGRSTRRQLAGRRHGETSERGAIHRRLRQPMVQVIEPSWVSDRASVCRSWVTSFAIMVVMPAAGAGERTARTAGNRIAVEATGIQQLASRAVTLERTKPVQQEPHHRCRASRARQKCRSQSSQPVTVQAAAGVQRSVGSGRAGWVVRLA